MKYYIKKSVSQLKVLNYTINNKQTSLSKNIDIFYIMYGYLLKKIKTYTFLINNEEKTFTLKDFLREINSPIVLFTLEIFKIRNILKKQNIYINILGRAIPESINKNYINGHFIKKEKIISKKYRNYFEKIDSIDSIYVIKKGIVLDFYNYRDFNSQYDLDYAICDAISCMCYTNYIENNIDCSIFKHAKRTTSAMRAREAVSNYLMSLMYHRLIPDDGNRQIIKDILIKSTQ
ncbi:hypothetical protein [Clostridioides sp. ZZV15-6597]|uniref:hypothetical protein n=1 Tax=Clostridioides sp. ZZV15-6597 TaxID=2811500 RepID=UPI001D1208F1|nr:hypothetical protein [Clostridioides sp. ZZV15-6597]